MLRVDRRLLQNFDWPFLGLTLLLLGLGLLNLWSATSHGEPGMPPALRRQLVALAVGFAGLLAAVAVDYRTLERYAQTLYLAVVALLLVTLAVGRVTRGTLGWIALGPVRFQPSELAKVALVIRLAAHFHRHPPSRVERLVDLLRPGALIALPVGAIVLQRDLGVAVLTLLVGATYLPLTRIRLRAWGGLAVAGAGALAGAWTWLLRDYQRNRILDVLDPERDPLSSGYQVLQSLIAVGSGQLTGRGYMEGTQTQLSFLPTQHTDFVFSVLAEEWGFLGCAVVLGLYMALLLWGLLIARSSKDGFGALLAVGLVGCLFWPAAINIAMVLGLAPVIGVPLPLFSYGGSSLVTTLICLGLLLNVSMRRFVF